MVGCGKLLRPGFYLINWHMADGWSLSDYDSGTGQPGYWRAHDGWPDEAEPCGYKITSSGLWICKDCAIREGFLW